MLTEGLLDEHNSELWRYLNERHHIELRRGRRPDYLLYSEGVVSLIDIPDDKADAASFTHQLLHLDLWVKDVYVNSCLIAAVESSSILSGILKRPILEHIANSLEHLKMFPVFIDMGYKAGAFLSDYQTNRLTEHTMRGIKEHFKHRIFFKSIYSSFGIASFITSYFTARSCPAECFDYSRELQQLKSTAPLLYGILERFTEKWNRYDVTTIPSEGSSYELIIYEFVKELELWAKEKRII